ncbi:YhcN/YlaJ family sporulation lipoprotein [Neobacillus sp. CF12]|uniref:YhcN/YlaJ family sporulation lipoprotein n=1 Tax=Neobacillus sp. CF12 TaxID=3055864 RepID=UPI0025A11D9F|nr:YhcN/YlaJ family sporulation lipoprotein [Neobacillus sp. CF12]MDM5330870.1 YhcN/YlaJ family sporulation lipoprotein [Neobacillus sp. CF12]
MYNLKQWMIPLSALLAVGLSGCANDDRAAMDKDNKNMGQPVGYYSDENHKNGSNGMPGDNDGPITEFMDHNLGVENQSINEDRRKQFGDRDENGNPPNPTKPLADHDHNFFQRDNQFSTSDANYHGHLNQRLGNTGTTTKPETQDRLTERIKSKVAGIENVREVRSVLYGNSIMVSVKYHNNKRAEETKRAIQNAVKPLAGGKSVQVITDDGALGREGNRNNDSQLLEPNSRKHK